MLSCFSTMSESVGEFGVLRLQLDSRRLQLEHVGYISSHWRWCEPMSLRKEGRKERWSEHIRQVHVVKANAS
jgi:hypothetical protein